MLQRKEFQLLFLLTLLTFSVIASNLTTKNSENDTVKNVITQDETILFNMINDMRRQNKLPSIPLSLDLCKVAQTHIADLIKWKPQEKGCSLHSWSGSGKWTSCCNTKEVFGIQCMKAKPREITGYAGDGYELIYWGEDNAIPAEAAELWKQVEASSDMILSRAKWSSYQWKALGVGVKDGYAVLWLGDAISTNTMVSYNEIQQTEQKAVHKPENVTKISETEKKSTKTETPVKPKAVVSDPELKKKTVSIQGPQYYLIVGSYKDLDAANSELNKVRSKGYTSAFILFQEPLHRIAIVTFSESEKASRMKNELKETFPGIWIFKK
jgi:cell division septation protein DedD